MTETFANSGNYLTQGFHQNNYEISTIIENLSENLKINVYPNPTVDFVSIEISESPDLQNYKIQLFDMQGKLLIDKNVANKTEKVNLSRFANSTLILKISNNNQVLNSFKIQKIN